MRLKHGFAEGHESDVTHAVLMTSFLICSVSTLIHNPIFVLGIQTAERFYLLRTNVSVLKCALKEDRCL